MTRHAETTELTPQRGTLEQITLTAHSLAGLTYASEKLVADGGASFEFWLSTAYADALQDTLRWERIHGTGVGEGLGILHSPAFISVAKEDGQTAATVLPANVFKMASRTWGFDERGTSWVVNPMLRTQVSALADPDTGKPLFEYARSDGERGRLLGRPCFFDERAAAPGSLGDIVVAHWPEYIRAVYQPATWATSIHVRFLAVESAFRLWERSDQQPWWRSALTPGYGTDTLSPYVALAARE